MADNTQLNPGSGGDVIATDDIGGVKFQRIKVCIGDDGLVTGDISAKNPMPIDDVNRSADVFQHPIHGGRYNQIEVAFDDTDPDLVTDITVTKNNGGDASLGTGQAVFTTSSNINGGVKAVTNTTVLYRPHFELYAAFSCIFTTGIANSYQRIGLYDTSNGFYIGYEGTAFGITIRKGGANTTTQRASFNVDTLTGAAGSNFTRNGVPESLDPTKDNLYRIRFGWLGAAPIFFEVMSPDGEWVVFHIIKHPNTVAATSINNPELPITLDIQKTAADATVLTVSTACWAAGTTSDLAKVGAAVTDNTLVKATKSVLVAKKPNQSYVNIDATAGGNLKVALQESDPGAVVNISDNGGSITVDGTVAATQSGAWSVRNQDTAGNGIESATTAPAGTERGFIVRNIPSGTQNVSVQNASIPVTDNGGSLTVDGTVAATQSGNWSVRNLDGAGNSLASSTTTPAGTEQALIVRNIPSGTQNVSVQNASIPVTDNGGSLTVDGSISISNFPATQAVSATNLDIRDLTSTDVVTVTGGAGQVADVKITLDSEQVAISNFPATQPVSGTVTADTELPTAAALADGAANPTTPTVGAANLGFNGTTWDRIKSEPTNADGEAVTSSGALSTCSHNEVFNGTTWDRMRSASALDGTGPTSHTGVLAVLQPGKRFDPANLGTAVSSTSSVDVNGSNSITVAIETATTGTFVIEGTADGINWGNPEVFDAIADIWVSGTSLTPAVGKVYQVLCGGFRAVRLRVTATLGATVAHAFNATMSQAFLGGIDTGPAPHNFGYTLFHKEGNYAAVQTSVTLHATTAGKRFAITDITVSTDGTTSGIVTIYDASGSTAFVAGTTPSVFRASFAPSATVKPGATKHFPVPYVSAAAGNNVLVTITGITASYIQINGYEI